MNDNILDLQTSFKFYTPSSASDMLDVHVGTSEECVNPIKRRKRKASVTVKKVTITPDMLHQQTVLNFDEGLDSLSDSSLSIYDGYVRRLIEGKNMFTQIYHENDTLKAVMNDYNCDDGHFRV